MSISVSTSSKSFYSIAELQEHEAAQRDYFSNYLKSFNEERKRKNEAKEKVNFDITLKTSNDSQANEANMDTLRTLSPLKLAIAVGTKTKSSKLLR